MSVVDDHSNVILSLMARSMGDGAASTLTLVIGPATRNRAGVLTAEGHKAFFSITQSDNHNNDYTTSTTIIKVVAVVQML